MHGNLSSLYNHVPDIGFKDPVATLLESYFLDFLKIPDFIISQALVGEYDSLKELLSLLLLLYFCYYLLINGIDGIILVMKLLEWLMWKFSFT